MYGVGLWLCFRGMSMALADGYGYGLSLRVRLIDMA